jgi:uncharacterized membrane protein
LDSRFSIDAASALSSGREADGRRPWIVWSLVAALSLAIVILIVGAPFAQSSGHFSLAAAIYQSFSFVCHQIPDRSLHLAGYQFAVCSRCTGIYFGFAAAALFYPLARPLKRTDTPSRLWLFLAAVPLGVDFALGYFSVWENTHWSRFLTGALLSTVAVFYVMPGLIEGASIVVGWFSRSEARISSRNHLR